MTLLMREQEKFEEGFSKGIEQGIEQVITNHINSLRKFNVSEDIIMVEIMTNYNLTEEEVRRYF